MIVSVRYSLHASLFFFFFNDTATTEIYTLSLHDALPICTCSSFRPRSASNRCGSFSTPQRPNPGSSTSLRRASASSRSDRSEEHTSELQSRLHLVCRLLLEKKKKN